MQSTRVWECASLIIGRAGFRTQVLYRTPPGSHPEVGHDDCVISDFGLAAYVEPNGGRLYTIAGSAGYSAPEMYPPEGVINGQCQGKGYGLKADMWSLGVIGESQKSSHCAFQALELTLRIWDSVLLPWRTVRSRNLFLLC